jgi:hypothetical protein
MYFCHQLAKSWTEFDYLFSTHTITDLAEKFMLIRYDLYMALEKEGPDFARIY